MYRELTISSDVPASKLKRAFKGGKLTLSKAELCGSGATIHLHPESYAKAVKAKRCGRGTRLAITHHEIGYPMKQMIGNSIWGKIWDGIKSAFRWAKDSGVLSKIADAAVAPIAAFTGQPAMVMGARQGLKQLTGIGVEEEGEGFKEIYQGAKRITKKAFKKAKESGLLTKAADAAERELIKRAPQYEELIRSGRKTLKQRTGIGMRKPRMTKGSPEAIAYMARLRAMRKGGSFRLE